MTDSDEQIKPEEQLEASLQVANAMSLSLLFSLGRQYLDVPLDQATFIQPVPSSNLVLKDPYFLQLEQVGSPVAGSLQQPFIALQTALSACHHPGRYTLIFLVSSDGSKNHIFLGARSHDPIAYNATHFIKNLGHFLKGNLPGTRFQLCPAKKQEFQDLILTPLSENLRYGIALTGIPALKPGEHLGYPQSLDRLLAGLRGSPFLYMVIAEPMEEAEVNAIIYNLRELMGRVHSLSKLTLNETWTKSILEQRTITKNITKGGSRATSEGTSETTQVGTDTSAAIALGAIGIATLFPPAALMTALTAGGLISLAPSLSRSWQKNKGITTTETWQESYGISYTTGLILSAAEAFGREYINAHAQAAEEQIKHYVARFEQARASGCWNVGVYLRYLS